MKIIKIGGSILSDVSAIKKVALAIKTGLLPEERCVVVVSAFRGVTDELLSIAKKVSDEPSTREVDMLISTGERVSMALLAIALDDMGIKSVSLTGSQAGIITNTDHNNAKIIAVRSKRILHCMNSNQVVIVAGFQGVSQLGEITTLGRGGSDTTAIAICISLLAQSVYFIKDVGGLYSADPRANMKAELVKVAFYDEVGHMQEKASQILHERALALGCKNNVVIYISSIEAIFLPRTTIKGRIAGGSLTDSRYEDID